MVVHLSLSISLPVVRKHFNSDFLPNELVSVSHLEAKSFAQATQPAGTVAPGNRNTKTFILQYNNDAYKYHINVFFTETITFNQHISNLSTDHPPVFLTRHLRHFEKATMSS